MAGGVACLELWLTERMLAGSFVHISQMQALACDGNAMMDEVECVLTPNSARREIPIEALLP